MTDTINTQNSTKSIKHTRKIIVMALFVALTYLANFLCNFKLGFLSFEAKDAVTLVCAYAFGPVAGCIVAFLSAVIESLTASATGIYGFIMNVAGSVTFVAVASLIYKIKKNTIFTALGVALATIVMTIVMVLLNIAITPFYMKVPRNVVIDLIAPMLLPFNIVKGLFNGAITLIIKQPILKAMELSGAINQSVKPEGKLVKNIAIAVGIVIAVLSLVYFIVELGGKVELFK